MNPKYPLYIVSKGRWEKRKTVRALERMKVPYHIIVDPSEYKEYAEVINSKKILVEPKEYRENYDTCDLLGDSRSKGSGPARNFAWEHSIEQGFKRHWVVDDNISYFYRHNHNNFYPVGDGSFFRVIEDFCDRYKNVAMAGPHYKMFMVHKHKLKPFILNTRVYSCNLILNDVPYRWRGRFNEDTDLSLRMLKDGWCTILFYAFTQEKTPTLVDRGGNTDSIYRDGTLAKSKMLVMLHPDVAKLKMRFGRWHHIVDYSGFKDNKLIPVENQEKVKGYNYKLIDVDGC